MLEKFSEKMDAIDTRFMDEHDIKRLNEYHAEVYRKISPYDKNKAFVCRAIAICIQRLFLKHMYDIAQQNLTTCNPQ